MWDLPRPGLEPVSPALAGGFLTTAPPEKPEHFKELKCGNSGHQILALPLQPGFFVGVCLFNDLPKRIL